MKPLFFAEAKLVWKKGTPENRGADKVEAEEGLENGTYKDTEEYKRVIEQQNQLMSRLRSSDLFTDTDRQNWQKKVDEARANSMSEDEMASMTREFESQQSEIKGMVDTHTQKVLDNKKILTANESKTSSDPIKERIRKFAQKSLGEKREGTKSLDLELSELQAKLNENTNTYTGFIKDHKKLFHNPDSYIKEFEEDLTLEEQADWISKFQREIAVPRQKLVNDYDALPAEYKDDAKFFKVGMKEKQAFLDKLDMEIERKYLNTINSTPSDVMSRHSKHFAVTDFLNLRKVYQKAAFLNQLPKSIEVEQKLTKKYKKKEFDKVREFDSYSEREWERLRFEEKEALLKKMEAEIKLKDTFDKMIKEALKDKTISETTNVRYDALYAQSDINGRSQIVRNILYAMKVRRQLVKDFEDLGDEAKKKFNKFYKTGYKGRLQMFKEAKLFDTKQDTKEEDKAKEEKEKKPKSLESKDIAKIVNELHQEADKLEANGETERAMDKHVTVLKLHPENEYSKKKKKELGSEAETLDTLLDIDLQEAAAKELQSSTMQNELEQLKLARMIKEDQEELTRKNQGRENLESQTHHLGDNEFNKQVHREVYKRSGGKKALNRKGELTDVEKVDLGILGKRDTADIRKYKDRFEELKNNENIENLEIIDESMGRSLRGSEIEQQYEKRKAELAKKAGKNAKNIGKTKREDIATAAADLIDDEVEAAA